METPTPSVLAASELESLRQALESQYPNAKNVLGSQLGAFIRRYLVNPELKVRFGGLKNFVAHYFPAEIAWRGRRGLDDLYDVSFSAIRATTSEAWLPVPADPSPWLWSAVTNPSIFVQFALSLPDQSLVYAVEGIPLREGLVAVGKLTKADYREIAHSFVQLNKGIDTSLFTEVIDNSGSIAEFTALIRKQGLASQWEAFRVDNAVRIFTERLGASGAETDLAAHYADLLKLSQQQARAKRITKAPNSVGKQSWASLSNSSLAPDHIWDTRAIAGKAMEFLTDEQLNGLHLPLGSVMQALKSLRGMTIR